MSTPATVDPTTVDPTTVDPTTMPPVTAPTASGFGSVSADDLASVLLPSNPALLRPAAVIANDLEPQAFLDAEMSFTGMDPVIEIAGAPITLFGYTFVEPVFETDGTTTDVQRLRARYRMAVEIEPGVTSTDDDPEAASAALRDELRPVVEAAHPGQEVTDTDDEGPLGNTIYGLTVGPTDEPTTTIEIEQHYFIVPRPVEDPLLSVMVTRVAEGTDVVVAELPSRDLVVGTSLQAQLDLYATIPDPIGPPESNSRSVTINLPSANTPTIDRRAFFDVEVASGEFARYVDTVATVLEANDYRRGENFGQTRTFDHIEERLDDEVQLESVSDTSVSVIVQGDRVSYPE